MQRSGTNEPSLFYSENDKPLWSRLRPEKFSDLTDYGGFQEIFDRFQNAPFSLLLYGPPGTGKTTFLEILLRESNLPSHALPATSTGLEDIRKIMQKESRRFILFMDEIHRFQKSRQDFLLKPLEEGRIVLIAATTESPWYYLTRPLLSRLVVKQIQVPDQEKFIQTIKLNWQKGNLPEVKDELVNEVVQYAWPDFRRAYQLLESLLGDMRMNRTPEELREKLTHYITENPAEVKNFVSDEYDLLSAYIKSLRGSDPDAAVLYMARMLDMGVDPTILCRRQIVFASEDIGLADSQALVIATQGLSAVEKIGMPEARIILSHVTIYLAAAPKSNSAYRAVSSAYKFVRENRINPPGNIVNSSKEIKNYLYPHDHGGWVKQNYWPSDLGRVRFYEPGNTRFEDSAEGKIRKLLNSLK